MIERDDEEKIYFIVESKGSELALDLRDSESTKIECAKEHFKAISDDVQMIQAKEFENFKDYY